MSWSMPLSASRQGMGTRLNGLPLGWALSGRRATTPGEAFLAAIAPILESVGPLPHARLDTDGESTARKKQKARMLKCECATCGYTGRAGASKWGPRRSLQQFGN